MIKVTVLAWNVGQDSGKVGSWEYCVVYDNSKLTLVTPTSVYVTETVGHLSSEIFIFKVKSSGSSNIIFIDVKLLILELKNKFQQVLVL